MTIKEKLETIKGKTIAIWCEEEWMADKLYEINEERSYWNGDDFCVDLEDEDYFSYCDVEWYRDNDFEVVKFKDFINGTNENNEKYVIQLTQQDIN